MPIAVGGLHSNRTPCRRIPYLLGSCRNGWLLHRRRNSFCRGFRSAEVWEFAVASPCRTAFCLASADLRQEIAIQIRESCGTRNLKDSHAFLLVVGATDNTPVRGGPFESNFGLARARAERVRDILLGENCNMPVHSVLALVSGPRHTDAQHDNPQSRKGGTAEDRSVDVWAFWDRPTEFELLTSVGAMRSQQACSSSVTAPTRRKK